MTRSFQRRSRQPYGAEGGAPGEMGRNVWIKQPRKEDGDLLDEEEADPLAARDSKGRAVLKKELREPREINIGGKATIWMGKGDRLVIETPGGGGWGDVNHVEEGIGETIIGKIKGAVEWAARGSLAERAAAQAAF